MHFLAFHRFFTNHGSSKVEFITYQTIFFYYTNPDYQTSVQEGLYDFFFFLQLSATSSVWSFICLWVLNGNWEGSPLAWTSQTEGELENKRWNRSPKENKTHLLLGVTWKMYTSGHSDWPKSLINQWSKSSKFCSLSKTIFVSFTSLVKW